MPADEIYNFYTSLIVNHVYFSPHIPPPSTPPNVFPFKPVSLNGISELLTDSACSIQELFTQFFREEAQYWL